MAKKYTRSTALDLTKIMADIIQEYGEEVTSEAVDTLKDLAPEIVDKVKSVSPKSDNASDHYSEGWTAEKTVGKDTVKVLIFNKDKPTLTHLLENGHRGYPLKNGGRTRSVEGTKHIAPTQKWAEKQAMKELERRLKA